MPPIAPYDPAVLAFYVLPAALVALFAWACAWVSAPQQRARIARLAALAGLAWLMLTWRLAATGVLRAWDRTPPPFFALMLTVAALAALIAFGPLGRRIAFGIPLWVLIAVQAFRFPLELAMHRLAVMGIMPEQMSYTGRNFDIVTGVTAIVVALMIRSGRGGRRLALTWNVVGIVLLVNIVAVAVLSTPVFRFFGAERVNVFVTYPPYVWLPTVMVLSALAGHLLIFRQLLGVGAQNPPGVRAAQTTSDWN